MSIRVAPQALESAAGHFPTAFLLSTGGEAVKAVAVDVTFDGEAMRLPRSKGSAANIAANPVVTVLFPPAQEHGYALIVDGTAEVTPDAFVVTVTGAILHRPGDHADGPPPPAGLDGDTCRI